VSAAGPAVAVSVIVPAYNAGRFLRAAIDSALAQDYRPIETIVVDDGSTDDTAAVAKSYGSRIVFVQQPNRGTSAARNRGVALATGEIYAFLDADDMCHPNKIALQVEALARDPSLDIVFTQMQNFRDPSAAGYEAGRDAAPLAPVPGVLPGPMALRRASFDRVGSFDESSAFAEFAEWLLRSRDRGLRERVLPQVLLRRRIHDANKGVLQRDEREMYIRYIKAALDRRRAAGKAPE
jgi:glycosyltransferase involved in cell wall biosynthesis